MAHLIKSIRDKKLGRFFERAFERHDLPEKITLDKSGASPAAVNSMGADGGVIIELCQSRYLNNLIEQDHPAIKQFKRVSLACG